MRNIVVIASVLALLGSGAAYAAGHGAGVKAPGQATKPVKEMKDFKKPKEDTGKVGYSEDKIRLKGMMVPIRLGGSTNYEVITVQLALAPGETARPACWMVPIVHEKMLMYLAAAHLEKADFEGERRQVLAKNLFNVAVQATDRGYYTGAELVDEATPPLEGTSKTLSGQCS
jgi:hypothetical protein